MSIRSAAHDEMVEPDGDAGGRQHSVLFRQAQTGDRGAFGQIVTLYQDRLYNAVLRMVGDVDEARDLTQETFTRALMKLDTFRGESGPYTWLFRIAFNLAITQLRKVQRQRTFSISQMNTTSNGKSHDREDQASSLLERVGKQKTDGPDACIEKHERDGKVIEALGRLDPEYRAVLVMRDIEGFDYQQMAELLGLALGTLKSRLFRARIALRDELKEYMKG